MYDRPIIEHVVKETILGMVEDIMPAYVTTPPVRQSDALGLGHAVLCAKHLVNNEPFAVQLTDVRVLDQASRDSNYTFASMMDALKKSGIGQVMVKRVSSDVVEN